MQAILERNLLKYACGRAMFCACGNVLDVDKAGFREDGTTVACCACLARPNPLHNDLHMHDGEGEQGVLPLG